MNAEPYYYKNKLIIYEFKIPLLFISYTLTIWNTRFQTKGFFYNNGINFNVRQNSSIQLETLQ